MPDTATLLSGSKGHMMRVKTKIDSDSCPKFFSYLEYLAYRSTFQDRKLPWYRPLKPS